MRIIIDNMDFKRRSLSVSIESLQTDGDVVLIIEYFRNCWQLGFSSIVINIIRSYSLEAECSLRTFLDRGSISGLKISFCDGITATEQTTSVSDCSVTRISDPAISSRAHLKYYMRSNDLSSLLDDSTRFVLTVGYSIGMSARALSNLRLCIYELTANTVEHSTFLDAYPMVAVQLDVDDIDIQVSYSDNGTSFMPEREINVDLGQKIKTKSRRGLGLFLLQKLTRNLQFERDDTWNRITFRMPLRTEQTEIGTGGSL